MNKQRTAIITGASSGIGFSLAKSYLRCGYNVVANGRSLERLERAAAVLKNPDNLLLVAGDIALPETAENLFACALERFGQIDILVNNAGIFIAKPVTEYSAQDLDEIIDTNLKGFFFPTQVAARHMIKQGFGHIIAVTAALAMQPNAKMPALLPIMIKGGINSAIRGLALELAGQNVMVNAVAPGVIETPMHVLNESSISYMKQLSPTGRIGKQQDIVDAVLYLTDAKFVSGTIIPVDGGSTAGVW